MFVCLGATWGALPQSRYCELAAEREVTEREVLTELRARSISVLFVPGFLSDAMKYTGPYFDDQIAWLRSSGIDAAYLSDGKLFGGPWDSEQSVAFNSTYLQNIIETGPNNTLIVGHSMGGNITQHALVTRPRLQKKVIGVVTIQTPFEGAELADWVLGLPRLKRYLVLKLLRVLGGNPQVLRDLSTGGAREFLESHAQEIQDWVGQMPVLTFGTSLEQEPGGVPIPSDLAKPLISNSVLSYLMGLYGVSPYGVTTARSGNGASDGAVSLASSHLPGTLAVDAYGVDHMMTVAGRVLLRPSIEFDRALMLQVLLRILFEGAGGKI